jgi:hypothetical protein
VCVVALESCLEMPSLIVPILPIMMLSGCAKHTRACLSYRVQSRSALNERAVEQVP